MSDNNFLQLESDFRANYNAYAQGLDTKNWDLVRSCFADEIYIDYGFISAPTGAPEVPRRADDWLMQLQMAINGFDITRHTITNHRLTVDGESLSCTAYLIADHIIFPDPEVHIIGPENIATVVGEYKNNYKKVDGLWKISKSALDVHWSSGNIELFDQAVAKAMSQ
ncbi:nuclear transport factor 2 family protein [Oceanicoccus sp. KOV_DT_Chl]|uniref:nuclear transport factor 2 family protein n=1 Tax=Oceanicoccus sp. KOV_DT_Chl TaxID=1904639 RepID=UPI000C7DD421|nr:nuclear transport factor 2 family protein [Oceanicoccus sp. KOV_DT_Chl]